MANMDRIAQLLKEASIPNAPAVRFDVVGHLFAGEVIGFKDIITKDTKKPVDQQDQEKVIVTLKAIQWTRPSDGALLTPTATYQPDPDAVDTKVGTVPVVLGELYTLWMGVNSNMFRAAAGALKDIGATNFAEGQQFVFAYTGDGTPAQKGWNAPKLFVAQAKAAMTAAPAASAVIPGGLI